MVTERSALLRKKNAVVFSIGSVVVCFYLKDCEKVRELKIGYHSFCDYDRCVTENTPLLEAIEIGDSDMSDNFIFASTLKLKSVFHL